jgi:hypothetical protein
MSRFTRIKIILAGIGLVVLIWGIRVDDSRIRWVGIIVLAASVLMRFVPKRLRDDDYRTPGNSPPGT